MPAWDALVVRFWREGDGVRGRVLRVDGGQVAAFSSAREAGDLVERLVSRTARAAAPRGGAPADPPPDTPP
jgi:hypothetical protein